MTADAGASPQTLWRGFPCEALAPRSPREGPSLAGDYCHCTNETTLPNTFKVNDAVSASASASRPSYCTSWKSRSVTTSHSAFPSRGPTPTSCGRGVLASLAEASVFIK